MWELDYKESQAQTNWCFWTVVLEKTLESPLDYKEIQQRNINNFRYADDTTLMAESEELKRLLTKVKEESEKAGLKAQHSEN